MLSWLAYDWDLRKVCTVDLLRKIRLGLVPLDKLTAIFENQLRDIAECMDLYHDILKYYALGKQTRVSKFLSDHKEHLFTPRGNLIKVCIIYQLSSTDVHVQ